MQLALPFLAAINGAGLLSLVVQVLVAGLILWLLFWLVNFVAPPEPFRKVITVILAVVGVIWLINILLSLTGNAFIQW